MTGVVSTLLPTPPPLRVLVIDDDELDRFVIRRSFNALGEPLELIEVDDPRNAVEAIATHKPDVTLLDIQMPTMDGFDVLKAINAQHGMPGSSIIMLSSSVYPEDEKRALGLGAQTYRVKPSTLDAYLKLASDIHSAYAAPFDPISEPVLEPILEPSLDP